MKSLKKPYQAPELYLLIAHGTQAKLIDADENIAYTCYHTRAGAANYRCGKSLGPTTRSHNPDVQSKLMIAGPHGALTTAANGSVAVPNGELTAS